jgi:ribosomal protein S18 acetylase RimI-like enzyme
VNNSVIRFTDDPGQLTAEQLHGFFVGWPASPTPEQHLAVLLGSHRVQLALADHRVVGFVNAISDGLLTAFIPWLEVLPEYQGQGIGTELMRRILASLGNLYSIDLTCDPELRPYYERLGLRPLHGMGIRNATALSNAG